MTSLPPNSAVCQLKILDTDISCFFGFGMRIWEKLLSKEDAIILNVFLESSDIRDNY